MEDKKWELKHYAKALKDLEEKESEVSNEEQRIRKYLECIKGEYNKEADREYFSFLWDFSLPEEDDTKGCLLYAVWACRAYDFIRDRLPKSVIGTSSELY
ncbi:MAG: hypothetical protein LUD51_01355 [Clostridia bacterium]|nr:hypothetical protein [Clostridia bacterium]